jgi:predicted transposase YdaD
MMAESEKSAVAQPHDRLVRNVLADADIAADLLGNYLEPGLVSKLDLDSLKREAGDTVNSELSKLEGDLRYSARFKGGDKELKVFVFMEHQSSPDRFMSFRMLGYIHAVYQEMLPKLKKGERFPYPLAVVLHHGESPWKNIPPMRELIDIAPDVESDILGLPIRLIDVATMSLDELRGHPMVCALLDSLQSASTGLLSKRLTDIYNRLRNVRGDGRLKLWSTALGSYYVAVQGRGQKNIDTLFQALKIVHGTREAEKMTTTIADEWKAEGIAIGKAEGKAEGKIESTLTVLQLRFGEVPAVVQKKVRNVTDSRRIDKMLAIAVDCESLKEFQKTL